MMYLLLFKKLFGMTCLKMNTILKRDFRLTYLIGRFQNGPIAIIVGETYSSKAIF